MSEWKDQIIALIQYKAEQDAAELHRQLNSALTLFPDFSRPLKIPKQTCLHRTSPP